MGRVIYRLSGGFHKARRCRADMPPSLGDSRHDLGGFEPNVGARKSAPIAEHCSPSRLDVFRATLERPWDAALLGNHCPCGHSSACVSPAPAVRFARFLIRPGVHDRKVRIKREAGALDEQGRRCPRNGNRPRPSGIAVRSTATVFRHGKVSVMRVESPETGLTDSTGVAEGSTVKRCCPSSPALVPALLKSLRSFEEFQE